MRSTVEAICEDDKLPRTYDSLEDQMIIAEEVYENIMVLDESTEAEAR